MNTIDNFQNYIVSIKTSGQGTTFEPKFSDTQKLDEVVLSNKSQKKDKKSYSTKKLLILSGATIAAVSTIAGILLFRQTGKLKPAKFKEFIEFVPSQTMDEAKEFALKNFNIKTYELDGNIEVANWVNEALTNINNMFKGKAHMPKSVKMCNIGENSPAQVNLLGELELSKQIFGNKDALVDSTRKLIEKFYDMETDTAIAPQGTNLNKLLECIEQYKGILNKDYASVIEWENLSENIYGAFVQVTHPTYILSLIANNQDFMKILRDENFTFDLAQIYKKTTAEKFKILTEVLEILKNKTGKRIYVNYAGRTNSLFTIIYHEMGHIQHHNNMNYYSLLFKNLDPNFTKDFNKQQIAQKVSWYAQTSPDEFVAEVFANLCEGIKMPDDVMKLYKEFNGFWPQ